MTCTSPSLNSWQHHSQKKKTPFQQPDLTAARQCLAMLSLWAPGSDSAERWQGNCFPHPQGSHPISPGQSCWGCSLVAPGSRPGFAPWPGAPSSIPDAPRLEHWHVQAEQVLGWRTASLVGGQVSVSQLPSSALLGSGKPQAGLAKARVGLPREPRGGRSHGSSQSGVPTSLCCEKGAAPFFFFIREAVLAELGKFL